MRVSSPPFYRVVMCLTTLSLLLLFASTGFHSVHFGETAKLVLRRGAMELAICSYPISAVDRDGWRFAVIDADFPPRTFWYPTARQETVGLIDAKTLQYRPPVTHLTLIQIPLAVPTVGLSLACIWLFLLRLQGMRSALCRAYGYDLTGNVSGRCPECGIGTRLTARVC